MQVMDSGKLQHTDYICKCLNAFFTYRKLTEFESEYNKSTIKTQSVPQQNKHICAQHGIRAWHGKSHTQSNNY